jgi:hypothetical protein
VQHPEFKPQYFQKKERREGTEEGKKENRELHYKPRKVPHYSS